MADQGPGGLNQMPELTLPDFRTGKLLPGGVDVHPADLEQPMPSAEGLYPGELLRRVTVGHVGYRPEAELRKDLEEFLQIGVLEGLSLLVPSYRFADIPQIGVG